jgi:tRNA pseudouridine55 synthase
MSDNGVASLCGVLLLRKPAGISSARAVAVAKRALGGCKVGHLGTLDPFAAGLLPLAVGEGTKLAPYLNHADKRYRGVVRLGVASDTLDSTGQIVEEKPVPVPSAEDLARVITEISAAETQMPPAFSAIKKDGVPMYRRARAGEPVELEPRPIHIYSLALEFRAPEWLDLTVHCSKGTYVRAMARDIGQLLGTVGLLESLERTAFGPFHLERGIELEVLENVGARALETPAWVGGVEALDHLRELRADPGAVRALRAGQQGSLGALGPPRGDDRLARVVDLEGRLVAVLAAAGDRWTIDRVFSS